VTKGIEYILRPIRTKTNKDHRGITMYSLIFTTALLLSTAQAVPVNEGHELAKRQVHVLAGAPISDISVKADNLVQCAQSTISWTGAVVSVTAGYHL
jgi:hypothetical protein